MTIAVAAIGDAAPLESLPAAPMVANGAADFTALIDSFASVTATATETPIALRDNDATASPHLAGDDNGLVGSLPVAPNIAMPATPSTIEGIAPEDRRDAAEDAFDPGALVEGSTGACGAGVPPGLVPGGTARPAVESRNPPVAVAPRCDSAPPSTTASAVNLARTAPLAPEPGATEAAPASTENTPAASSHDSRPELPSEARPAAARVVPTGLPASALNEGLAASALPPLAPVAMPSPPSPPREPGATPLAVSPPAAAPAAVGATSALLPAPPGVAELLGGGTIAAKQAMAAPPPVASGVPTPGAVTVTPSGSTLLAAAATSLPGTMPGVAAATLSPITTTFVPAQPPRAVTAPDVGVGASGFVLAGGMGRGLAPRGDASVASRRALGWEATSSVAMIGGPSAATAFVTTRVPSFATDAVPPPLTMSDAPAPPTALVRETGGKIEVATARLGVVQVAVDGGAQSVGVRIGVETAAAATLLGAHQARLEGTLSAAGSRLDALSVDVRGGGGDPHRHTPAPAPADRPSAPLRAIRAAASAAASRAARPDRYA